MLVTFQEIRNEVYSFLKIDSGNVETSVRDSVNLRINQIQDLITFFQPWEWRKRTFYLTTRDQVTAGTVAVTQNSRTVTGTSTSWDEFMKLGYLYINSRAYKIQRVASTTSLTLEAPYPDATESGVSYEIIFPSYPLPYLVSSIISVLHEGVELDLTRQSNLTLALAGRSLPQEASFGEVLNEDFYNTGTVAVTNGSATVTGTSTSFNVIMEGMDFRVNSFSKPYRIRTRDSATQLTLEENYQGSTASGQSYAIAPRDTRLITFRHTPDDYYFMEIEALIRAPKLIDNNEYSIIPDHTPLIFGSIYLAALDFKNENPVRIQQARADFERSLKQLTKSYKPIANIRWQSEYEYAVRKEGLKLFNPLSPTGY